MIVLEYIFPATSCGARKLLEVYSNMYTNIRLIYDLVVRFVMSDCQCDL